MRVQTMTMWLTVLTATLIAAWTLTAQQPRKIDDSMVRGRTSTAARATTSVPIASSPFEA
jgi:hypothetical protein